MLNTDNINVTGESFDYGPWRFLPTYDPGFTAAYFDETGLYAFGRQPATLLWNLTRLAECLLPLAPQAELEAGAGELPASVPIGLGGSRAGAAGPALRRARCSTASWSSGCSASSSAARPRSSGPSSTGAAGSPARSGQRAARRPIFTRTEAFAPLHETLAQLEPVAGRPRSCVLRRPDPCTMLIDEVEALWASIAQSDDWAPLEAKLAAIETLRQAYSPSSDSPG